ncbi:Uu.00g034430.m01.CDS01 [Anthostomella pinea]|uniref:Uu.00g034430.m01.CDS01 n=1 Tax=Anthostomella pinea TaxID=933095 RepID=A0AAI8VA20_9PEZI|nr:Uu.00g034430.m01.CDS01 [Anthostomella pinea]
MAGPEEAAYSHGHHSSVVSSHARRTAKDSAAFLLPHLQAHFTILDIGCGPGTITADLAELVPEGKVTGVDFSESVLDQAHALTQDRGITNCVFETLDANGLPYADDMFDVVFCHQVLQHVGDPIGILKEMQRVAKPGGIVAAREADYKSFAWYPEPEGLEQWGEFYQKTARACGGEPNAGRYVRSWARGAGFVDANLQSSWSSWFYIGDSARNWGESWTDRALKSDFARNVLEHSVGTQQDLENISRAWKQWATEEGAFIAIPSGELLYTVPKPPT